ncbi:hypothetical protein JHK82_047872 [Glycine max]|uniref:PTI1-like tyrosine-protein kinase n=2 Tax=Glycine subgen. Soja TaxID=1462606 RepID=A0A0R0FEU8_SOYBN|nr:hypothetical protein JHK86_047758 [Glycine max]KAG4933567.1 hypothetical protein JHK87_047569 [Glycine soja]KAG4943730.1 hypothetical protein JHK85_048376 [Glycine max]KAG5098018.1 hypothetical protein JHK82_047872 [Glycine max]KAG5102809.1 hypothetical protein JHK84_047778 [Glycine max]
MQQRTGNKKPLWRVFSLKELHSATNNFNYDNKLSERGFDSVYWGQLWDGSQVINFDLWVFLTILGLITIVVFFVMVNIVNLTQVSTQHSAESLHDWNRRMNIAIGSIEGIV